MLYEISVKRINIEFIKIYGNKHTWFMAELHLMIRMHLIATTDMLPQLFVMYKIKPKNFIN